jgi:hypothetical protein
MKRPVADLSCAMTPFSATLLFFAFTAPLGIAAHLIAELVGLGWRDDAALAFSARHGYLALIGLGALVALVLSLRAVPGGDRRARIEQIVDALPFKGEGIGFFSLSFAAQFVFFAVTQIGEGSPLLGGDVFTGVLAAALASFCGALAVVLGKRRLLDLVLAVAWAVALLCGNECPASARFAAGLVVPRERTCTPFAFRYRPPPLPS